MLFQQILILAKFTQLRRSQLAPQTLPRLGPKFTTSVKLTSLCNSLTENAPSKLTVLAHSSLPASAVPSIHYSRLRWFPAISIMSPAYVSSDIVTGCSFQYPTVNLFVFSLHLSTTSSIITIKIRGLRVSPSFNPEVWKMLDLQLPVFA